MQHGTKVREDSETPNDEWKPMRELERRDKSRQAQGKGAERDIPKSERRESGIQLQAEGYPVRDDQTKCRRNELK